MRDLMFFLIGMGTGLFIGMWFGLKAFAAQRKSIDHELRLMAENVAELATHMHDGRVAPDAVYGWIAQIRTRFNPHSRRSSS